MIMEYVSGYEQYGGKESGFEHNENTILKNGT